MPIKGRVVKGEEFDRIKYHNCSKYQNGAEGMIAWCNDNVYIPIYPVGSVNPEWTCLGELSSEVNPETGKNYNLIWEGQKEVLKQALQMKDGRFKYRLICFCWMRGEGKSLLACLIQLWKFFCWSGQKIMLGANSRDQVKFVHFDIMRDIILNSPNLKKSVRARDIQEKEIRLRNDKGEVINMVRSISSFSGIVSNITGYTFSEMFDMKNPRFYVQLDGSIRNIPNALGVIDSTVSEKTHPLYQLYQGYISGKLKEVFFSYRCSRVGALTDYWNPNMTESQLADYKYKFPFGEYEKYFLNLWSAGHIQVFSDAMIRELGIFSYRGKTGERVLYHKKIKERIDRIIELENMRADMLSKGLSEAVIELNNKIEVIQSKLTPVSDVYKLKGALNEPLTADSSDLEKLTDVFNTDWAIMAGLDMADPMAKRGTARSILTVFAKGLPGSKRNEELHFSNDEIAPKYLYILLALIAEPKNSVDELKKLIEMLSDEYNGIDTLCSERYGVWDMVQWCEEKEIAFEPIHPTYDKQRDAFKEVFTVFNEGRIKAPPIGVIGVKGDDIFREELSVFDHDPDVRWFGSPEKKEKRGIQDDSLYSAAWCLYGGRNLVPEDFRSRKGGFYFGEIHDTERNDLTSHF